MFEQQNVHQSAIQRWASVLQQVDMPPHDCANTSQADSTESKTIKCAWACKAPGPTPPPAVFGCTKHGPWPFRVQAMIKDQMIWAQPQACRLPYLKTYC
eukprot:365303-Chlamydomonas_euryale.AAC.48